MAFSMPMFRRFPEFMNNASHLPPEELQKIITQKEVERKNFSVVMKMIVNKFININIRGDRKVADEAPELLDLLSMLEKALWHGLIIERQGFINVPADDLVWGLLCNVSFFNASMHETVRSVKQMDNLRTTMSKVRAYLRIAIMKKEIGEYIHALHTFSNLKNFYEPWAFFRNDNGYHLGGFLMGLRIFDCNLLLDFDVLVNNTRSVDLTLYLNLSPKQFPLYTRDEAVHKRELAFQALLEQKCCVEDQNKQLKKKLVEAKDKLSEVERAEQVVQEAELAKQEEHKNNELLLEGYKNDVEKALGQIQQKVDDQDRLLVQKMENLDLSANNCFEKANRKFEELAEKLKYIEKKNNSRSTRNESDFFDLVSKMEEKQDMLNASVRTNKELIAKIAKLEEQAKAIQAAVHEAAELRLANAEMARKLAEAEQALEDLGPHLSDSKMQIVSMKEQLVPSSEWAKDTDVTHCLSCNTEFTVTLRKHHCRRCGQIFCDQCSNQRLSLPSHAKQVRVCEPCFKLLGSLHASVTLRST